MNSRQGIARDAQLSRENYNLKALAQKIAKGVFFGICAYFAGIAELPFGARPFGIALLAATGKDSIFVYFGLIISAFSTLEADEAMIYFAAYSALLVLRVFSRVIVELRDGEGVNFSARRIFFTLFCEKIGLRVVSSALFGAALGSAMLFAGGLLYYDLFGLLIVVLLSPIATLLLCGYVGNVDKCERARNEVYYVAGFLSLCAITAFGARGINIYGVSLSVAFGLIVTFYVTCRFGVGYGSIGGLALGLCYSPMLSPFFVISALCMGVFSRFSVALACFAAFFASCAWAFYILGISALIGVFGGILSACLIYSVIHKMIFLRSEVDEKTKVSEKEVKIYTKCKVLPDNALDAVRLYEMNARTSALSDGLYRLSLFFEELKSSGISVSDAKNCAENYNSAFLYDVTEPEYRALSLLLSKTMKIDNDEYCTDRELSQRLCQTLTELNLDISGVLVYGVRKRTVFIKGKNRELLTQNARVIIESISSLVPFAIDLNDFDLRRDGEMGGVLLLFECEKNSASVVKRRVNAKGEEVCGDSFTVFKNKDNRFFAFLSDGMGSGNAASAVSSIAVGFLGNMLSSGGLHEEIIEMLNGFLCSHIQKNSSECSATLDLFELDLMNGHSTVYKCGAAPSYIYRRGRLFKMRSESMPIGILNEVDLKKYELELSRGDVIVMVSDGVTGEGEECPWLFDLLAQNLPNRTLDRTADLIVKYATAKGTGDDITVLLVRVE
ncbi:MAG: hypothetical protein E7678_01495 [Ruminococcaceae bacterium]|nr:hypothetical protein [Oscillospiraceae bacterium]